MTLGIARLGPETGLRLELPPFATKRRAKRRPPVRQSFRSQIRVRERSHGGLILIGRLVFAFARAATVQNRSQMKINALAVLRSRCPHTSTAIHCLRRCYVATDPLSPKRHPMSAVAPRPDMTLHRSETSQRAIRVRTHRKQKDRLAVKVSVIYSRFSSGVSVHSRRNSAV